MLNNQGVVGFYYYLWILNFKDQFSFLEGLHFMY